MRVPIHAVSTDEAERADFVVCAAASGPVPFTDNEQGECSLCGCRIIYRPNVPKAPPKVCLDCAMGMTGAKH